MVPEGKTVRNQQETNGENFEKSGFRLEKKARLTVRFFLCVDLRSAAFFNKRTEEKFGNVVKLGKKRKTVEFSENSQKKRTKTNGKQ